MEKNIMDNDVCHLGYYTSKGQKATILKYVIRGQKE